MNRKETISCAVIGAILSGAALVGFIGWRASENQNSRLQSELAQLRRQEKISAVQKSVSKQMEMIAYEQKEISDEQREEAIEQTKLANEMRERSEEERQKAIIAQQLALASERKALDAYDMAEQQRQIAEHQRIQAEIAMRKTDTLSYLSLGRSLGSMAVTQYHIGNQELSELLSYAAYFFTQKYGGDVYDPSIYQPLTLISQSKNEWDVHEGAITNTKMLTKDGKNILTVSSYGEIQRHQKDGDKLVSKTLFFDKNYDFRNVYTDMDNNIIYALSRTGHLVIRTMTSTKILEINGITNPTKMTPLGKNTLIIGEDGIGLFDPVTEKIKVRHVDFHIVSSASSNKVPLLFDDKGNLYEVKSLDEFVVKKSPVVGQITSFVSNKNYRVFGMNDGNIYLLNRNGDVKKFTGHRSRVTKMRFNGNSLYSSSLDGTVNRWDATKDRTEPVTLYSGNCWILHFSFDNDVNYLWVGNQKGHLAEALLSIPIMVDNIQKHLKRNFTQSEWNYYIGASVPYVPFINTGKEVMP